MNPREIQQKLQDIGWPITVDGSIGPLTRSAIQDFQIGWTFQDLAPDGDVGPLTAAAIRSCWDNSGKCSEFFAYREFSSKGNGWVKVHRQLARRLDDYRRIVGSTHIHSGHRDKRYNDGIPNAAKNSQHVYGTACDVNPRLAANRITELGFSGIGIASSGLVLHMDVRAEGPNNTTGARVGAPTIWRY